MHPNKKDLESLLIKQVNISSLIGLEHTMSKLVKFGGCGTKRLQNKYLVIKYARIINYKFIKLQIKIN